MADGRHHLFFILVIFNVLYVNSSPNIYCTEKPYKFYTKTDWDGAPSTDVRPLKTPVPYVVIHHTYLPAACSTPSACKAAMRSMQNYHKSLDWGDIGYKTMVSYLELLLCAYITDVATGGIIMPTPDLDDNEVSTYDFPFSTRSIWLAKAPIKKLPLRVPVPYVVIHHSYIPAACYGDVQCRQAMRSMQNYHMEDKGWWDIGYHFGVGSNGVAYEGRGWKVLGAHALHFNNVSIGICLIGDWINAVPPPEQLKTAKSLIAAGVDLGYIKSDYKLVGHRQVRETECPGDALYREIQNWDHYSPFPHSVEDLDKIDLTGSG